MDNSPDLSTIIREFEKKLAMAITHNIKLGKLAPSEAKKLSHQYLQYSFTTKEDFVSKMRELGDTYPLVFIVLEPFLDMKNPEKLNATLDSAIQHLRTGEMDKALNTLKNT
jgi:hypothetical protein